MLTFKDIYLIKNKKEILSGVFAKVEDKKITALLGRNGSGKSSLLSLITKKRGFRGDVIFLDEKLSSLSEKEVAKRIAYLPQRIFEPHVKVYDTVAFGRSPNLDFTARLTERDREIIHAAMEKVGILELSERFFDTLSGGEKQKVSLAMILAMDTPLIVLDEPTSSLDKCNEAEFLFLVRKLKEEEGKTFLIVLHDLSSALEFADNFIVLDNGRIVFSGEREDILKSNVLEETFHQKRYTRDDGKIFFSAV